MDIIDNLTNEKIKEKYDNQFDLVNYAIKLASEMIQSNRPPRVDMETENPAVLVLEEISEGKDKFEKSSLETKVSPAGEVVVEEVVVEKVIEKTETQEVLSE